MNTKPRSLVAAGEWCILLSVLALGPSQASTPSDEAFRYLYNAMDQAHCFKDPATGERLGKFDVYSDKDAAGNHFASTGFMGDRRDLSIDPGWTNEPSSGIECLRIGYSAEANNGSGWSGIYWQYSPNNWGDLRGSYDLRGVTALKCRVRGEKGGEKVELKFGGINRPPFHNPTLPFQDSCDSLTTGLLTLSNGWTEQTIDLATPEQFYIYRDHGAKENHYAPSGWMGDWSDLAVDEAWTNNPFAGSSCIRISYSSAAALGQGWAGIYWQVPAHNWGDRGNGFNLKGATKLTFRARSDLFPGQRQSPPMRFFCGGINVPAQNGLPYSDSFKSAEKVVRLTDEWQEFTIDLRGYNLSNVIGALGWTIKREEHPRGRVIYLDEIRFDTTVTKDLSSVIGGFCVAMDKATNPNGCVFYIDDVRMVYAKDSNTFQARMQQRGFPPSYEVQPGPLDEPLRNVAFVYDVSLVILALVARGIDEDLARAKLLADALCFAQDHDRLFHDGRLRNAYRGGDLVDPATGNVMQPGWWSDVEMKWLEDKGFNSTSTGNLAWAMLALLGHYKNDPNPKYLNAAARMGEWIATNTLSSSGFGGYTGGVDGWETDQRAVEWKSTEHAIDLYAAFTLLSQLNPQERSKWLARASHAAEFVEKMWHPDGPWFWTGTMIEEGVEIINRSVVPVDVQAWAIMTMENWRRYSEAIMWVNAACRNVVDGFDGFTFSYNRSNAASNLQGVWFEGTAQMSVAYQIMADYRSSGYFVSQIERSARPTLNGEGRGIPAASRDHHPTGFDWEYHNRLHVGATSWYLLAKLKFNPYWQIGTVARPILLQSLDGGRVRLSWFGDSDTSFVVERSDALAIPQADWFEAIRIPGERRPMSWEDKPSRDRFYRLRLLPR